ncbi:MAG: UPF0261 family protein [Candidatus Abyssobacteria bacterium SURF_5]|uniref:UPF0261 family protein n=1 Tax=Abyssobacteria bacterium (strain SURF_5) TaxID=2093360 RepID=A0A3A4NW40_ABYX5|nr:MAG: UPF0261 family protein [Candidatus Abyssubacteria bacterium SURF_5]
MPELGGSVVGKTILIVATLDTRGDEVEFLRELIVKKGHRTLIADAGVVGSPRCRSDIPREMIAEEGGKKLEELIAAAKRGADRYEATKVMAEGVAKIAEHLHATGELDGIMSLGGSTGAMLGAAAMKKLPIGVPKLIVTTYAALAPIGEADITVMQSPIDLVGLNRIVKKTLSNAAGAMVGMVEQELADTEKKMVVGITALGVTTPAVQNVIAHLEKRGIESIVFHAKTTELDELINQGSVTAVIDLTSFETVPMVLYSDEMVSLLAGSPEIRRTRLDSASDKRLPQIIAPGGLDMHILPGTGKESIPAQYQDRAWTMHGEYIVLFRTNKAEMELIAKSIADRVNRAKGPVAVLIPRAGFSEASRRGAPLFDPEADEAFISALKANVDRRIEVEEIDCHINDGEFADRMIQVFDRLVSGKG